MYEYLLGNKYHWTYSSSVGSSYQDTAYLDLGVVTNTGRRRYFEFYFFDKVYWIK